MMMVGTVVRSGNYNFYESHWSQRPLRELQKACESVNHGGSKNHSMNHLKLTRCLLDTTCLSIYIFLNLYMIYSKWTHLPVCLPSPKLGWPLKIGHPKRKGIVFQTPSLRGEQFLSGREYYMDVSKNRGTPKWMVYNGKLIKMDDLVGKPTIFGNIHILD